jgi:hypothetical protein
MATTARLYPRRPTVGDVTTIREAYSPGKASCPEFSKPRPYRGNPTRCAKSLNRLSDFSRSKSGSALRRMSAPSDYAFVSEKIGFALKDQQIQRTVDGGRTWKSVNECAAKVQVDGLTRVVQCSWAKTSFSHPHHRLCRRLHLGTALCGCRQDE